jgi:hypothetical protein
MTSDHQPKKYHKSEILALCQDCPDKYSSTCILGDLEASHAEYIYLPLCAAGRISDKEKKLRTNEECCAPMRKKLRTNEDNGKNIQVLRIKTNIKEDCATDITQSKKKSCATIGDIVKINGITLDSLDKNIITFAAEYHHARSISRKLNRPESTIMYRLNKMEKAGLISQVIPENEKPGAKTKLKCYHISEVCATSLIYNDKKPPATDFTVHAMSFIFPILEGTPPKSAQRYKMNHWEGSIFTFANHKIRVTTKSIIIDINEDLGAGSIDDLNLKYSQLAQSHAYKFAEKHHIVLGGISKYRQGHFTIEDNALAQIISERGEFKTTSGIMIDKSRSSGDLEMQEDNARAFEFTINKLPTLAAGMKSNLEDININMDAGLSGIMNSVNDMQTWLILERENRALKELTLKQDEQIELLKQQITQKDELNDLKHPKDHTQASKDKIKEILEPCCKCGARMHIVRRYSNNQAVDIQCTHPTCGRGYHILLKGRDQLQPPGTGHQFQKAIDYAPAVDYRCTQCKTSIPKDQALRTFEQTGSALCNVCERGPDDETQT